ncbi:4-carboxymuconolactone decarboxylase [hydrothermal vent metagenome]|uniref:4-carboxymuconolactone decarboxylase n=1 Tax=hydrothermal vent metagenome TaxID=652676 RepID=A0A3B0TPB1_9ZZZZ
MEKSNRANRYSAEERARAVRMIFEHEHEYANQSAAIIAIAPKIGCGRDTLRRWVKQSDIDSGRKDDQTSDDRAKIKAADFESDLIRERTIN